MVAHITSFAFDGVATRRVQVQVQIAPGLVGFHLVGLPDKAVAESRERVRAALHALGLALPAKRLTVNLAPADVLKEGSHFDLPIALGVLTAMDVLPAAEMAEYAALGELGLDGTLLPSQGVLPAGIAAVAEGLGLICPAASGPEAAWAGDDLRLLAAPSLLALINHVKGQAILPRPEKKIQEPSLNQKDLKDIKGQESAKRALEVAAAGGHNLLLIGPPGSGKSMLAARLLTLLPPLSPAEALQVSMIHSVAGQLQDGALMQQRPFRDPHHSASLPALVGGGLRAKPGEISLAHQGVLFLDELPEFSRQALEALRQPLETGRVSIARANHHVTYPARFQLIAAMNPCRCGFLDDPQQACGRAPKCGQEYQARLSGPLLDRIDMHIDVPAVSAADLSLPPAREDSAQVAARVAAAREWQQERFIKLAGSSGPLVPRCNAEAEGDLLDAIATPDAQAKKLLTQAAERMRLSARGYHRVVRVARTLADLAGRPQISSAEIAEALSYRRLLHQNAG